MQRIMLALLLIGYASVGWSFPWDQDMVNQPSQKPYEFLAPPEPNGIPIQGGEIVPAPKTEEGMYEAKEQAASIINPIPATDESIARGRELYKINCLVCHGAEGRGEGPVGQLFEYFPLDLTEPYIHEQTDGQIFFQLTRGGIGMPLYRDALSQNERWDVINFFRKEFGQQ